MMKALFLTAFTLLRLEEAEANNKSIDAFINSTAVRTRINLLLGMQYYWYYTTITTILPAFFGVLL